MENRSAKELAKQAEGNVEPHNLIKDGGMIRTYLYDGPLINYLDGGEQPHYVFSNINTGLKILDESGEEYKTLEYNEGMNGKIYLMITNSRIIYVSGIKGGDHLLEWNYDKIDSISKSMEGESTIHFATPDEVYAFVQVSDEDRGDGDSTVDEAIDYVSSQIEKEDSELTEEQNGDELEFDTESEDTTEVISCLSNINPDNIINNNIPQYILEMDGDIKQNEVVHYAYSINVVERGDNNIGDLTTKGCLLATDRRLTAYVNKSVSTSKFSIGYKKINTVEVEYGATIAKLSVQSTPKTYSFGFSNIRKSEIHNFSDFIKNQASEPNPDYTSGSNVDPTEQLKNIKELHDQGVLTDEEFENKKQSLLDKL